MTVPINSADTKSRAVDFTVNQDMPTKLEKLKTLKTWYLNSPFERLRLRLQFLNAGIFQYSIGKRKKIRWLKVHITIRLPLALTVYSIDIELEGFETPEESRFLRQYRKNFRALCQYRFQIRT